MSFDLIAQTVIINGRTYEMIDRKWYQIENDINYEVDNSVITVKYRDGISQNEIIRFQDEQGVQVLRTNILGFVDLEIPVDSDPIEVVL